jgi:hypothetical protein
MGLRFAAPSIDPLHEFLEFRQDAAIAMNAR